MRISFEFEFELTKDIAYNKDGEPVYEYTFVVDGDWLEQFYYEHIIKMFHEYEGVPLNEFLDIYAPEIEGRVIYFAAQNENVIKEEGWAEVVQE
jgi:hypothetical protein